MERLFITFHGIDGTGKTTTSHELVCALNSVGYSAVHFDSAYQSHEAPLPPETLPKRARSLYKKIHQSQFVARLLESGLTVVKDRWHIDIVADAGFANDEQLPLTDLPILRPDTAVLLTCAESERQRRLTQRGNQTPDDLIPKVQGSRADYFENFLIDRIHGYADTVLRIDNTNLTAVEVVEKVLASRENSDVN